MLQNVSRLCAVNLLPKIFPFSLPRYENYAGKSRTVDTAADPRITLINPDENVDIVNLSEAMNKATDNNLKLVKITDMDFKTRRPIYKLMEGNHFFQEKKKEKQLKKEAKKEFSIKGLKTIILASNIGEHDFQTKCKSVNKWLHKQFEIKITIQKSDKGASSVTDDLVLETIYARFLEGTTEKFKVQQKVVKEGSIKFYLKPLPPTEEEVITNDTNKIELARDNVENPPTDEDPPIIQDDQKVKL